MSVVVQQLSKVYGTQKAVNEISFEAHKGRCWAFWAPMVPAKAPP
jgi:ABC-type multidrug transport system ATPase subunit